VSRRVVLAIAALVCAVGVVAYQATRPQAAPADPAVFVPSPNVYLDFSPSYRTSIADAYYLSMVQYFGEHVNGDARLDALPQMVELVTTLSPHFTRAYLFGAFALVDAGRPDAAYEILRRGFAANPDDYRFPAYLGYFAYRYGEGEDKDAVAAEWYRQAAAIPGRPDYIPRLAATLLGKGGDVEKSVVMWGQVYLAGDKYSRQRAIDGLDQILPRDKEARMKALAPLVQTMPEDELNTLLAALFEGIQ
jgi:tetratricopeptide (TPR) repeat protein